MLSTNFVRRARKVLFNPALRKHFSVSGYCKTNKQERMKPTFRCGTKQAIEELSKEHYETETNDDKKFVLMEFIIQATNDQETDELFLKYCDKIQQILQDEFKLHEYTIHYWAYFDNEDLEDCWRITPLMRKIWSENYKLKLLFVCTVNRMRSATAHKIYETDKRFEVKSAGTDKSANTVLTEEILDWADSVVVMEKHHRNFIRQKFPEVYKNKKIVCLYIPDDYDYMQTELIEILREKVESVYERKLI
ncbi:MAG: hypothetical protein EAZ97_02145 [Bacteroidetes bacterium]|nr:MAG: hypothetical protein EAZ97_02145 [Bacteroidota bacterium]